MSSLPVRKIRSTSSLDFQFFDNLVDDKMVLQEYIRDNFETGEVFTASQIPLWVDDLGADAAKKKVIDLIWALVYKKYIDLEEGSQWPHLFKRRKEQEIVVYVKTKRKYNRKLRETRDSGVSDGGGVLDSGEKTT